MCLQIMSQFKITHFVTTLWNSGEKLHPVTFELVQICFDMVTFDNIERDEKIKRKAQLSLIGLLTGFSIISGIEIIFFIFRLI